MMYADRYANRRGLDPVGLAFAVGASGFLLFGLSLTAPHFTRQIDVILEGTNIPLPKDPPPKDPVKPQPTTHIKKVPIAPLEHVDLTPPRTATDAGNTFTEVPPLDPGPTTTVGTGLDIGTVAPPPPVHVPVLRDPTLDGRYLDYFQPAYPSDMRLAGREGRVVVRVLIGTDGRVKDVQQVSAASTAFFEATRKQALAKWRFKPGTKDGVPVEAWHTMAVRFVLDEG
jgi:periplasmic protein TonB